MATTTTKTYRCGTCGRSVTSVRRRRTCYHMEIVPAGLFRKPRYACGGKLTRVDVARKAKRAKRQPPTVDAKLSRAKAALNRSIAKMRRTVTAVKRWQRRVAALEKKAAAAQVAAIVPAFTGSGRGARAIALE